MMIYRCSMSTLYEQLKAFDASHSADEKVACDELTEKFRRLAKAFLYGGYIDVYGKYRIYPRTVEFYFHEEKGIVKDWIVYHRNGNPRYEGVDDVPYFPTMSLNTHDSGFDIAFENEEKKYRASVLIRRYSVYDVRKKAFIHMPRPEAAEKKYPEWEEYRSTLLRSFLNGFSLSRESSIVWQDDVWGPELKVKDPEPRQGVHKFIDGVRQEERDDRKWSFSAEGKITVK